MITKEQVDRVYEIILSHFTSTQKPINLIKIKNDSKLDSKSLKWIIKTLLSDEKIEEVGFQLYKPKNSNVKIPISWNGKFYGTLIGDEFHTKRSDLHIFRKFGDSFGLSFGLIKKLEKLGCKRIVFEYEGEKYRWGEYYCDLNDIKNSDLEYDNNGDLQKFIRISDLK